MAREKILENGTGASPVIWATSQRRTLLALVILFAVVLLIRSAVNRRYVSDPQPAQPARMSELADRLDPNVATADELVVLPQLGEKRAAEIVAFRERFLRQHPGEKPFQRLEDLLQIKGIGSSMIQTLAPHLAFGPTTQRS